EDFEAFNAWLDELHGQLEVAGSVFRPSEVLYLLLLRQEIASSGVTVRAILREHFLEGNGA
ncbi:MAG TPA: hypothetical protein VF098_04005, partial [Sphingomicrobium sp.]